MELMELHGGLLILDSNHLQRIEIEEIRFEILISRRKTHTDKLIVEGIHQNIQGLGSDASGRSQNDNRFSHQTVNLHPLAVRERMMATVIELIITESKRSMTPPCPGKILP